MSQPFHQGTPDDPIIIRQSTTFQRPTPPPKLQPGRVTLVLIGLSVIGWLGILTRNEAVVPLFISGGYEGLPEIMHGEVWRLVTPIFLHFNIKHIVFNMLMLLDLGTVIEKRQGPAALVGMVTVMGAISNLTQYYVKGPNFGGMSGVLYGLFGYIWIKSRVDPDSGYRISQQSVLYLLGWLALCFTGLLGPVANYAHLGGLAAGVLWGLGAPRTDNRSGGTSVA